MSVLKEKKNCRECGVELVVDQNYHTYTSGFICNICSKELNKNRSKERQREKIEPKIIYDVKYCIKCPVELQNYNWSKTCQEKKHYICVNCWNGISKINKRRRVAAKPKIIYLVKYCTDCDVELQNYNWEEHRRKKNYHLCNSCTKMKAILRTKEAMKDIAYRLKKNISRSIWGYLKLSKSSKNNESCLKYLGFTDKALKEHLEAQFEPWMNWENYGGYNSKTWNDDDQSSWKWSLDHITPQSDLPYKSMEDENFKKCWSLENLRPYSAKQNVLDGTSKIRHKKKDK
jgi:hypothetical protein